MNNILSHLRFIQDFLNDNLQKYIKKICNIYILNTKTLHIYNYLLCSKYEIVTFTVT